MSLQLPVELPRHDPDNEYLTVVNHRLLKSCSAFQLARGIHHWTSTWAMSLEAPRRTEASRHTTNCTLPTAIWLRLPWLTSFVDNMLLHATYHPAWWDTRFSTHTCLAIYLFSHPKMDSLIDREPDNQNRQQNVVASTSFNRTFPPFALALTRLK